MTPLEATALPSNLAKLLEAMHEVGVQDLEVCTWLTRHVLRGHTEIHWGKFAGTKQRVGWSFPDDNQPYPEYAPHWFHVAGDLDDGKGGSRETDHDETGALWVAWSRPVGPNWIAPYRSPKNLYRATVTRFWKAVL